MSMLQEFKTFALKGNVVDMAVGVIIGAAFGKIVSSMVEKVLMPLVGLLVGGMDFTQMKLILRDATSAQPEVAIGYGVFVQNVVDFAIVAFVLFLVIRGMNRLIGEKAAEAPKEEVLLLRDIRDSLKR